MGDKRTYKSKPCGRCGNEFQPHGAQKFCENCDICSVEGCDRPVAAYGRCGGHRVKIRYEVPSIPEMPGGLCGIENCGRMAHSKGHCQMHYGRMNVYGSIGAAKAAIKKPRGVPCEVDGCIKPARGDGLCLMHYRRRKDTGDVGSAAMRVNAKGEGNIKPNGYRVITVGNRKIFEHRHVMETVLGRKLRKGENIHHRNGDRLDNRECNLELWMTQQPSGQRVEDRIADARRLLRDYHQTGEFFTTSEALTGFMSMAI